VFEGGGFSFFAEVEPRSGNAIVYHRKGREEIGEFVDFGWLVGQCYEDRSFDGGGGAESGEVR